MARIPENRTQKKPDVPDNFKKYKTKTIPKNIIFSKSKYDLKTSFYFNIFFSSHVLILAR